MAKELDEIEELKALKAQMAEIAARTLAIQSTAVEKLLEKRQALMDQIAAIDEQIISYGGTPPHVTKVGGFQRKVSGATRAAIIKALREESMGYTTKELSEKIGKSINTINQVGPALVEEGVLIRDATKRPFIYLLNPASVVTTGDEEDHGEDAVNESQS